MVDGPPEIREFENAKVDESGTPIGSPSAVALKSQATFGLGTNTWPTDQVEYPSQLLEAMFPRDDILRRGRHSHELVKAWAWAFMVHVPLFRLNFLRCFCLLIFFLYMGCRRPFIWKHYAKSGISSKGQPALVQIRDSCKKRDWTNHMVSCPNVNDPWIMIMRMARCNLKGLKMNKRENITV